jgi:hypothetical protein
MLNNFATIFMEEEVNLERESCNLTVVSLVDDYCSAARAYLTGSSLAHQPAKSRRVL